MPITVMRNDFVYDTCNMLSRPGNLQFNQFGRAIEARQVLIQVEWVAIIGAQ